MIQHSAAMQRRVGLLLSTTRQIVSGPIQRHVQMCIDQKLWVLNSVRQSDYMRGHGAPYYGSVGGHMRHSLDHFSILLETVQRDDKTNSESIICYDERDRNTDIESNKEAALQRVQLLATDLQRIFACGDDVLRGALTARFLGDCATGETYDLETNFLRELSFVCHHATHHLYFCRMMMDLMDYDVSGSVVGVANSTILNQSLSSRKK